MLAAPPAAAITYVNDSIGLDPSVYGGGGSASSDFPDDSPGLSFPAQRTALVSETTDDAGKPSGSSSNGGAGAVAEIDADGGSAVTASKQSISGSFVQ